MVTNSDKGKCATHPLSRMPKERNEEDKKDDEVTLCRLA
jgi:hypothetical protein